MCTVSRQPRLWGVLDLAAITLALTLGIVSPPSAWGAANSSGPKSSAQQSKQAAASRLGQPATVQPLTFDNDDEGPLPRLPGKCLGLTGSAYGLCVSFCEAHDCYILPDRNSCQVLRTAFQRLTGRSVFPCEIITPATFTPTPAGTPTGTASATITSTATPNDTDTPTPTITFEPTATDTSTPTDTDTPTETDTDTPTPVDTATATAIPTGSAAATLTSTPAATPTETTEIEATATSTSAAATATHTSVPATETATAANTATETPVGTPTGTVAATVTNTPEATTTATSAGANTATATSAAVNTATATSAAVSTSTATPVSTNTAPASTSTATPVSTNTAPASTSTVTPTVTDTPTATIPPTPTVTVGPACPLMAGRYTETTTGGSLKVSTFMPFTFPAGGTTVQDVGDGDANCVHTTVIPYPGGLTVPVFCVPALGYSVQVSQTGCGIGEIDSNGGSDFTVIEKGDTSYNLNNCAAMQPDVGMVCSKVCHGNNVGMACSTNTDCGTGGTCSAFVDSSGEIDITVGDGTADTCSSGGTGNAIVSIPVNTLTWLSSDGSCPDMDGMFNPDNGDTEITQFPQTLDLTSDTSTAQFFDNDGDGCFLAGAGPAGPFMSSGQCINFTAQTVNVAGGGTVFSSAAPLHDLLFTTVQNSNITGPTASGGATCASPPVIDFNGLAHRCIIAP